MFFKDMKTYVFDREQAIQYGIEEATLLWHITYWVEKNKANNKNCFDGRYWTYNSASALQEMFPFWSIKQIRRILKSLEDKGAIVRGQWSEDKYDHTYWYTLGDCQNEQIDVTESESRCAQMGTSYTNKLPNILPDNIPPLYSPQGENTSSKNKKKAQAQTIPPAPPTPLPFTAVKVVEAWYELCKMPKWKNKPKSAIDKVLKKLSKYPEDVIMAAIEDAIMGNYQGIFPDKFAQALKKHTYTPEQPRERKVNIEDIL